MDTKGGKFGVFGVFDVLIFDERGRFITEMNSVADIKIKSLGGKIVFHISDTTLNTELLSFCNRKEEKSDFESYLNPAEGHRVDLASMDYRECKIIMDGVVRKTPTQEDYESRIVIHKGLIGGDSDRDIERSLVNPTRIPIKIIVQKSDTEFFISDTPIHSTKGD